MIKKFFTINWSTFISTLLPPILRKRNQTEWVMSLLDPLQTLYEDILYRMQHNGQVIYIEKVLNEAFNPQRPYIPYLSTQQKANDNLIFISDSYRPSPQYVYLHSEILTGRRPLKVYLNDREYDNVRDYNYFLSLASEVDFKSFEYFNFKINIPKILGEEFQLQLASLESQLGGDNDTELRKDILKLKNTALHFRLNTEQANPNSIYVNTPRFHNLVNYYRIAGKSYETQQYEQL